MKHLKPDPKLERILAGAVDALQTAKEQLTLAKAFAAQMQMERDEAARLLVQWHSMMWTEIDVTDQYPDLLVETRAFLGIKDEEVPVSPTVPFVSADFVELINAFHAELPMAKMAVRKADT